MLKSFFYSNNKFQPVYFWITLFCLLIAVMLILRCFGVSGMSDGLLLGAMAFIEIWVLLYNMNKKSNVECKTLRDTVVQSIGKNRGVTGFGQDKKEPEEINGSPLINKTPENDGMPE